MWARGPSWYSTCGCGPRTAAEELFRQSKPPRGIELLGWGLHLIVILICVIIIITIIIITIIIIVIVIVIVIVILIILVLSIISVASIETCQWLQGLQRSDPPSQSRPSTQDEADPPAWPAVFVKFCLLLILLLLLLLPPPGLGFRV